MNSVTVPRELVERILLLLDTKSMLKCRLVNREFNAIIHGSTLVQYLLACNAAGVIDNPQSPLSSYERLAALKKREDAWRKLEPVFETTIKAIGQSSTFYELTAGNYFLDSENEDDLYYCGLPSSSQDNPQWRRISDHASGPGQSSSGSIIEMGAAVYEHDLVVKVISSELDRNTDMWEPWERYSLDLVLFEFSTGEYHPLARHPLIHVMLLPSPPMYTIVRIIGDSLALVVYTDYYDYESQLFIFDWKTGHKRLQHEANQNAYENIVPVFLSSELLLVPNRKEAHFEVWHLFPYDPTFPIQILSLKIPAVSDNYTIVNIRCHGEPSPFLHSRPYFPSGLFLSSWKNSIIIISIILHHPREEEPKSYQLIMHRRMLLHMIHKWSSPSLLEQEGLQTWTNQVTVHEVIDPDDRSARLDAQSHSCGVWTSPYPGSSPRSHGSPTLAGSQISPISHISADSSPSFISSESLFSTSRFEFLQVQWADWGPPISRWFPVNRTQTWFSHQSTGQRYVFLDSNPRNQRKCKICVVDFNLLNVKKMAEMMMRVRGEKSQDTGGNFNNGEEEDEEELEIPDHKGVFSEEVYMGLKCVVYHTPRKYYLDVVMMDEERLLGLMLDDDGHVQYIKVFYIG